MYIKKLLHAIEYHKYFVLYKHLYSLSVKTLSLISYTFTIPVQLITSIQKTLTSDLHSYRELTKMPETDQ